MNYLITMNYNIILNELCLQNGTVYIWIIRVLIYLHCKKWLKGKYYFKKYN